MQGKETSEREIKAKSNVGIDVSKSWLDVHVLSFGDTLRVPNTREGIRKLKRWLGRFDLALVVVEATGKWHRPLQRSLHASDIPVAVVDPFRVRMFAKAQGILAKTDRPDARVLAQFATVMAPAVRAPAPEVMTELAELVHAREAAVTEETSLKNQLSAATGDFLRRQLKRRIERIAKDITALAQEILRRIEADEALARRHAILTSIVGFGPTVAAILIACLAELGSCSRRQIAMLAGLAPVADESGERQGLRVVWGGRPGIRRILYLAAISAARHDPGMKAFFDRLTANGSTASRRRNSRPRSVDLWTTQARCPHPHRPKNNRPSNHDRVSTMYPVQSVNHRSGCTTESAACDVST
jgi:transposase